MSKKSGVIVESAGQRFEFLLFERDWRIMEVDSVFLPGAQMFVRYLGAREVISVSGKRADEPKVTRSWLKFHSSAIILRNGVSPVKDLLGFDYDVSPKPLPRVLTENGDVAPLSVFGKRAILPYQPPFQLTVRLVCSGCDGSEVDFGYIDYRREECIKTDYHGEIKILRKRKTTALPETLAGLIDFLEKNRSEKVVIIHG